jgi:hypothetical protein
MVLCCEEAKFIVDGKSRADHVFLQFIQSSCREQQCETVVCQNKSQVVCRETFFEYLESL